MDRTRARREQVALLPRFCARRHKVLRPRARSLRRHLSRRIRLPFGHHCRNHFRRLPHLQELALPRTRSHCPNAKRSRARDVAPFTISSAATCDNSCRVISPIRYRSANRCTCGLVDMLFELEPESRTRYEIMPPLGFEAAACTRLVSGQHRTVRPVLAPHLFARDAAPVTRRTRPVRSAFAVRSGERVDAVVPSCSSRAYASRCKRRSGVRSDFR